MGEAWGLEGFSGLVGHTRRLHHQSESPPELLDFIGVGSL